MLFDYGLKINDNYVRLINAAGQWRLKSINNKLTKVTYIWNGEMLGNFPSWGLKRAWLKQGNEVLGNLKETDSKGLTKEMAKKISRI